MTMTTLEHRVGAVLANLEDTSGYTSANSMPVLGTPAFAVAFAGGAAWGGAIVAAYEAGRAVRGNR